MYLHFIVIWDKLHHDHAFLFQSMNHWPWTPYSSLFFVNLKPVEISKNHKNIICTSIKVVQICKVWRVWLKNQACYAHFSFEIHLAIYPSILELKTFSSGFKLLRYRVKNVVFTAGLLLQRFVRSFRKSNFVFQIPAYLQQCLLKVGGDLKDKISLSKITHKPLE